MAMINCCNKITKIFIPILRVFICCKKFTNAVTDLTSNIDIVFMIFILGHSYPPFVMKNQKLREKLMLREFEKLVDQPKGLLWKI